MTTEQGTAIKTALDGMAESTLSSFVELLPAMAIGVGIAFVLYKVGKFVKGLGKGKIRA